MQTDRERLEIDYPSAESLDSGEWSEASGWCCKLYLVPALETGNKPWVVVFSGLGIQNSRPGAAHDCRWYAIGCLRPRTVGKSALTALQECERDLLEISDAYLGSEWSGSNHVGRWVDEDAYPSHLQRAESNIGEALANTASYWEAGDWFLPAGIRWEELCEEAGIDPKRALHEDHEVLGAEIEEAIADLQDEPVTGITQYAAEMAGDWVEDVQS